MTALLKLGGGWLSFFFVLARKRQRLCYLYPVAPADPISSLSHLEKSIIPNLCVNMNLALKVDARVNTLIKSCFEEIRRLSKMTLIVLLQLVQNA